MKYLSETYKFIRRKITLTLSHILCAIDYFWQRISTCLSSTIYILLKQHFNILPPVIYAN